MEMGACSLFETTDCAINAERFNLWARYCLAPTSGSFRCGEPNSVVLLVNSPLHHTAEFQAIIKERGPTSCVYPLCSTDLYPIELCFAHIKQVLRDIRHQLGPHHCADALSQRVQSAAASVTLPNALAYFRESHCTTGTGTGHASADQYRASDCCFHCHYGSKRCLSRHRLARIK